MPGWFVTNVADARAMRHEIAGTWIAFDDPEDRFPEIGVNIRVLDPGQPSTKYHQETTQEDFLVLSGECLAFIDGEERTLRAWDFFHCPAGTPHAFVGAGKGPCAILAVGARRPDGTVTYPVNQRALKHGASVAQPTDAPLEAYADWGGPESLKPVEPEWPPSG